MTIGQTYNDVAGRLSVTSNSALSGLMSLLLFLRRPERPALVMTALQACDFRVI